MKVLTIFMQKKDGTDNYVVKVMPCSERDGKLSGVLIYGNIYQVDYVQDKEYKISTHGTATYKSRLGNVAGTIKILSASPNWSLPETDGNDLVTYEMIFTPDQKTRECNNEYGII